MIVGFCTVLIMSYMIMSYTGFSRRRVPRAPPWPCSKSQLLLPQGGRTTELMSPTSKNWSPLKAPPPALLGQELALGLNSLITTSRYRHLRSPSRGRGDSDFHPRVAEITRVTHDSRWLVAGTPQEITLTSQPFGSMGCSPGQEFLFFVAFSNSSPL